MACGDVEFKLIERTSIVRSLASLVVTLERVYSRAHTSPVDRKGLILEYPVRCVSIVIRFSWNR